MCYIRRSQAQLLCSASSQLAHTPHMPASHMASCAQESGAAQHLLQMSLVGNLLCVYPIHRVRVQLYQIQQCLSAELAVASSAEGWPHEDATAVLSTFPTPLFRHFITSPFTQQGLALLLASSCCPSAVDCPAPYSPDLQAVKGMCTQSVHAGGASARPVPCDAKQPRLLTAACTCIGNISYLPPPLVI
jgi:hypothetical protein